MEVIYSLIPGMLIFGLAMVAVLVWAARSGQFDDLEGDGQRILMDEDLDPSADDPDQNDTSQERGDRRRSDDKMTRIP